MFTVSNALFISSAIACSAGLLWLKHVTMALFIS